MAFAAGGGSSRRVFPLQVQTSSSRHPPSSSSSSSPPLPSAAQRSLVPPKSPLHGGARPSAVPSSSSSSAMGGFDRLLLLRNMNVATPIAGAEVSSSSSSSSCYGTGIGRVPSSSVVAEEVSAAHNLRERKLADARRRAELSAMAREDYTDTPEGTARLLRQRERACMEEEELRAQRVEQHATDARRAARLKQQADADARLRDAFLEKRRLEKEAQGRAAAEKEAARRAALELKMKELKEAADRQAREQYAARQRQLADEARAARDARTAAVETALLGVEDALGAAMRAESLAELERRRQIEAEAREWAEFEAREAARQREETQRRRAAQKEQYEQDRARRMQIHRLQQDRVRTAARPRPVVKKQGEGEEPDRRPTDVPPVELLKATDEVGEQAVVATASALGGVVEAAVVPPPPALAASDLVDDAVSTLAADERTVDADASAEDPRGETEGAPPLESEEPVASSAEATRAPGDTLQDAVSPPPDPPVPSPPPPSSSSSSSSSSSFSSSSSAVEVTTEDPPPQAVVDDVVLPPVLSLRTLRRDGGVMPVAQVLSVHAGSPAAAAGLAPRDLVLALGGITSATPQCLVALAECVQRSVNQRVALVVLRPIDHDEATAETGGRTEEEEEEHEEEDVLVRRWELTLVPHKWTGKGLLGCQLSPFKWPTAAAACSSSSSSSFSAEEELQTVSSSSSSSPGDALVFHEVEPDSLASRVGLCDGDVLARCGALDCSAGGGHDVAAAAAYLQLHWRDAQRPLALVVQRWDATAQSYAVLHLVLPPVPPEEATPLGCALTTYTQFYYPSSSVSSSVCDACYASPLPSALHAAALSGHAACLAALAASCDDAASCLDWRDDEGRSPLFYACYARQPGAVRALLAARPPPYDVRAGADAYGDSPLHAAAASGCEASLALLLSSRFIADVDLPNAVSQATAAHVAASAAVLVLLHETFHADLLALDADGRTPLFYACLRGDAASVALLARLHPGFADYADSAGGNTPLHMAAWCGFADCVRALVPWLPPLALFVENQDGLDARALALRGGWADIARELEAWGGSPRPDEKDEEEEEDEEDEEDGASSPPQW